MKRIQNILYIIALLVLPVASSLAQEAVSAPQRSPVIINSGGGGGGITTPSRETISPTSRHKFQEPVIDIVPVVQPPTALAPEGTIVPCVSIRLQGRGDSPSFVDGLNIEVLGQSDAIEGFILLEDDRPIGPMTRSLSSVIANRRYLAGYEKGPGPGPVTFTVAALTRRSLADLAGNGFSVNIVSIVTDSSVSGSLPVEGATQTLNVGLQVGRMTLAVGETSIRQGPLIPLVSMQPLGELIVKADPTENQEIPLLTVDIHTEGGKTEDVLLGLYNEDGALLTNQGVEESLLVGQGTAKFNYPIQVGKGDIGQLFVRVRLGESWKNGGSIAFSVTPSKCVAKGQLYSYATLPFPRTVIAGPAVAVKAVATGALSSRQIPVQSMLPGTATTFVNLAQIAVTAPPDKDLVIPSLGTWIGWMPLGVRVNNLNFYGFKDSSFSQPIGGLRENGAFREGGWQMEYHQAFSSIDLWVTDANGSQSAVVIPAGNTVHFLLRGDYAPSGPSAVVFAGIYNPYDRTTLALQYLFR